MSFLLSALSALLYGCGDFLGGFASRKERVLSVMVVSQAAGLALMIACLPFAERAWPGLRELAFGALSGLGGALGLFMLYRGLSLGEAAVVSPVSAVVAALLPIAYGAAAGERPSLPALAGAALCVPAIILLTRGGPADEGRRAHATRRTLLHGLCAGTGFGLFFIFVSLAGKGAGQRSLWPLVAARSASIAVFLAVAAARRERISVSRANLASVLGAGLMDMGANVLFLVASRLGLLMLASAVTSLYPAPTVVLARVFTRERMGFLRVAGIVLAIGGCALIAVG